METIFLLNMAVLMHQPYKFYMMVVTQSGIALTQLDFFRLSYPDFLKGGGTPPQCNSQSVLFSCSLPPA